LVAPAFPAPIEPLAADADNFAAEGYEVQDDVSCASSVVDEEYVFEEVPADAGDPGYETAKAIVQSMIQRFALISRCCHKQGLRASLCLAFGLLGLPPADFAECSYPMGHSAATYSSDSAVTRLGDWVIRFCTVAH
jgi:hypothetical protein